MSDSVIRLMVNQAELLKNSDFHNGLAQHPRVILTTEHVSSFRKLMLKQQ